MDEEKVVLDRKSFEALAVDSRVRILKSLKQRRKTLSEVSHEMGMSVSGVKEHLEVLEKADLVRKMDDGHKWKYYELTKKGTGLVAPKELRVWVVLSIAMIGLVVSMLALLPLSLEGQMSGEAMAPSAIQGAENAAQPTLMGAASLEMNDTGISPVNGGPSGIVTRGIAPASKTAPEDRLDAQAGAAHESVQSGNAGVPGEDGRLPLFVGGISLVTILACLGILAMNRMKR